MGRFAFVGGAAATFWRSRPPPLTATAAVGPSGRRPLAGRPTRPPARPATAAATATPPPPPPTGTATADGAAAAPPPDSLPRAAVTLAVPTAAATERVGALLAAAATIGDVLLLRGPLGGGKTTLARGYVRAFVGAPRLPVTSPTYLLDNVYTAGGGGDGGAAGGGDGGGGAAPAGAPPAPPIPGGRVHHMDLWRLPSADSRAFVDWDEVYGGCVALIEWPDRLGDALTPAARLDVAVDVGAGAAGVAAAAAAAAAGGARVAGAPLEASQIVDWGFEDDAGDGGGPPGDRTVTLEGRGDAWVRRLAALRARVRAGDEPLLQLRGS